MGFLRISQKHRLVYCQNYLDVNLEIIFNQKKGLNINYVNGELSMQRSQERPVQMTAF